VDSERMRFYVTIDQRTFSASGCVSAIFRYAESERKEERRDGKLVRNTWSRNSQPTQADGES
jgi:hypothetical protein